MYFAFVEGAYTKHVLPIEDAPALEADSSRPFHVNSACI